MSLIHIQSLADLQDRNGATLVLARLTHQFSRLRLIGADGAYVGQ